MRFNGTAFTAFTVESGSLKENEVWALQEDEEGTLWIATYGGGITSYKDGRFRTFTTADGLADDVATAIAKDGSGGLWLSTPAAICHYSHENFNCFKTPEKVRVSTLE